MIRKKEHREAGSGADSAPEHPRDEEQTPEENPAEPPGDSPPEPQRAEDPAQLLAEIERARAREDELLRALAELTNVNRRRKQEMETIGTLAEESLIRSILPTLDDIDRALEASKDREKDPLRAGLVLIRERLWRTLEKEGLEAIRALGGRFDPELHDAMAQRPAPDRPPETVLEALVPGYRFRGRVLRHAQVVVAAPAAPVEEVEP